MDSRRLANGLAPDTPLIDDAIPLERR